MGVSEGVLTPGKMCPARGNNVALVVIHMTGMTGSNVA